MQAKMTTFRGKGTFLFPPITISEHGDEELGKCIPHQRDIVLDIQLNENIRILVSDDGFLVPITNLTPPENEKLLNTIIATLTTKTIPSRLSSWESDWADFNFEDGGKTIDIGYTKGGFSIRNHAEFERDDDNMFNFWIDMPRMQITSLMMKGFVEQAFLFYNNPEYVDDLLLIGESWSLSFDKMENASFLYSWMIIENMIEHTWRKYIKGLERTANEKDFLKNHNSWYISHMIQALSFAEKLSCVTRASFNTLRKIRNDIVHNRHSVTKDETLDCLNLATELVYDKLNYGDDYLLQERKLRSEKIA